MTTFPLPTLAATVTPAGVTAPPYADVLESLTVSVRNIYGADAYLDPDTQDGQLLAVYAQSISDANAAVIAVYNSFSPATAVGAGLSSNVKINGLQRQSPSNSTVDITVVGQAGTLIPNGVVQDPNDPLGTKWALPLNITIPGGGSILVTATCETPGAIQAGDGTITKIVNPSRGWQTANNPSDATPGAPVEDDAQLRVRQSLSTSLPAKTPLESIVAQVLNIPGVQVVQPYENDTGVVNSFGLPGHSIALVVAGGDDVAIATAIADGKIGTGTWGTTTVIVVDSNGVPDSISFSRPVHVRLVASVTLTPLRGYASTTGNAIATALHAWVAGLDNGGIGASVNLNDLVAAAKLPAPLGQTYKIEFGDLTIGRFGGALGTADVQMVWDEEPRLAAADVSITVL